MKLSFYKLSEYMDSDEDNDSSPEPLLDSGEESKAIQIVRNGMQLEQSKSSNFWDNFISLCSDAEAMSELLEVPKEKIAKWSSNINDAIEKIKNNDKNNTNIDKKKVIQTGDDQPLARADAQPGTPVNSSPM